MVQPRPDLDDQDQAGRRWARPLLGSLLLMVVIGAMMVAAVVMLRGLGVLSGSDTAPVLIGAAEFALPPGAEAVSLWRLAGEVLILTRDATGAETMRVFDADTGAEISATPIFRE